MKKIINNQTSLHGEIRVPGDKSISHRSIMLSSLSNGKCRIKGLLKGADCVSTMDAFKAMGIEISESNDEIIIKGMGLHGLKEPSKALDMGNSGTSTRLLSGILSGQAFSSCLIGDASLSNRPMKRIIEPLTIRNAKIRSKNSDDRLPLLIEPSKLLGIDYSMPVPSAQVKSCLLLSGLYSDEKTIVREEFLSRNHTELILKGLGADIKTHYDEVKSQYVSELYPCDSIRAFDITIPGDISSAAYFIAAALIGKDSEILVKNVNINPSRDGIIKVALMMGADITLLNKQTSFGEEKADILVKSSHLKGCNVSGRIIPALIDEIPVIAVMAAAADGETVISDAKELRVKESDRIEAICLNLKAMGADVTEKEDGMIIRGGRPLHGATIKTYMDHRIAMAFSVASLLSDEPVTLDHPDCVNISYPNYFEDLYSMVNQ